MKGNFFNSFSIFYSSKFCEEPQWKFSRKNAWTQPDSRYCDSSKPVNTRNSFTTMGKSMAKRPKKSVGATKIDAAVGPEIPSQRLIEASGEFLE